MVMHDTRSPHGLRPGLHAQQFTVVFLAVRFVATRPFTPFEGTLPNDTDQLTTIITPEGLVAMLEKSETSVVAKFSAQESK